jgi:acyl carrier protein
MIISSRTPEGLPSRCTLCGAENNIEFSDPGDDAPCPNCGQLLWRSAQNLARLQALLAERLHAVTATIGPHTGFVEDLGADSLETVELVMELEEEFGVNIPVEAAERIQTVGDAIRYLNEHYLNERRTDTPPT